MEQSIANTIINIINKDPELSNNGIKIKKITQEYRRNDYIADLLINADISSVNTNIIVELKIGNALESNEITRLSRMVDKIGLRNNKILILTDSRINNEVYDTAKKAGITIVDLIEVKNKDWKGRIKQINVKMRMISPSYVNMQIEPNIEFVRSRLKQLGRKEFSMQFSGPANEILFVDKDGHPKISMADILEFGEKKINQEDKEKNKMEMIYNFEKDTYTQSEIGLLPMEKIRYQRIVSVIENPIVIDQTNNAGVLAAMGIIQFLLSCANDFS